MNMIVTKLSKIEQAIAKIPTARTAGASVLIRTTHKKQVKG
jgi:hypothetical protein